MRVRNESTGGEAEVEPGIIFHGVPLDYKCFCNGPGQTCGICRGTGWALTDAGLALMHFFERHTVAGYLHTDFLDASCGGCNGKGKLLSARWARWKDELEKHLAKNIGIEKALKKVGKAPRPRFLRCKTCQGKKVVPSKIGGAILSFVNGRNHK